MSQYDTRRSADDYIPLGHELHARPLKDLYSVAARELLFPAPSIPLSDFPKLTVMTGGVRANEFTILCGATGSGKTTFCSNLSASMIRQGVKHFVASVETGATDYVKRVMSVLAGEDWNTGEEVARERLTEFHARHGRYMQSDRLVLSMYDNRFPVETLMADLATAYRDHGCQVAIVDNLNFFMEVCRANESVAEMDRVIHELIIFCKRVPIHVVMVMHPKKTDHGRVESEFDVKGSATAVQEAHNILLFNRPHPDLIKSGLATPDDREVKVAKMRRKGKFVHRRLILKGIDGVRYEEGEVV